jgi:hypothetical protein
MLRLRLRPMPRLCEVCRRRARRAGFLLPRLPRSQTRNGHPITERLCSVVWAREHSDTDSHHERPPSVAYSVPRFRKPRFPETTARIPNSALANGLHPKTRLRGPQMATACDPEGQTHVEDNRRDQIRNKLCPSDESIAQGFPLAVADLASSGVHRWV